LSKELCVLDVDVIVNPAVFGARGMRRALIALAAGLPLAIASLTHAQIQPQAGMLRWPTISKDSIAFSYANDLWIVPKSGGTATRLSSPSGQESFPRFSPDGQTLAFVGNYDGNRDLYTIPVGGGLGGAPSRVTHHPAGETLAGWTPDGRLLFLSNGLAGLARQSQLFTVSAQGGLPTKLPVPYAGFGSISADGTWLAYTLHSTDNRTWKRYRGGMATDVWLFNLKDNTSRRVTTWEGTDTIPMFVPGGSSDAVYYLSDEGPEHRLNVWSYTISTGANAQITKHASDDVRWPSAGSGGQSGEIVFQLGAELRVLDLATKQDRVVSVTIPGDRPKIRTRTVDPAQNLAGASISPSGKRVAVEARGDLWSLPAKEGVSRALTMTGGVAERSPAWSPDGQWIAYFSDEQGEYELSIRPSDAKPPKEEKKSEEAKGEASKPEEEKKAEAKASEPEAKPETKREKRKLTSLGAGYRFSPTWSPDSKRIAMTDANGRIFVVTLGDPTKTGDQAKDTTLELDKDPGMSQVRTSWSPDSRWLAYEKMDEPSTQTAIWIANLETGKKKRVTHPMFGASSPTFDRKGEFLFYVAQNSIDNPEYADIDGTFAYRESTRVLMVPLRKDVKNPWLPESDEETLRKPEPKNDEKKDESKPDDAKDDAKKDGEKKDDDKNNPAPDAKPADDGVSGRYSGTVTGIPQMPSGVPFTMNLTLSGTNLSGTVTTAMGTANVSGTFDPASGSVTLNLSMNDVSGTITGTIKNGEFDGRFQVADTSGTITGKRTSAAGASSADASKDDKKSDAASGAVKPFEIDFEGLEQRAMLLPITAGSLGGLSIADGDKLVFARLSARGEGTPSGLKIFDYTKDDGKEELITAGNNYDLSADGKKMLVRTGSSLTIHDASAGGGKSQAVSTGGLRKPLDPREEWVQIFNDAWRVMRDYFYEPTMHGVDWAKMREHYGAMLDDAASREDVNWILSEMISELNVGHAYLGAPGDIENAPSVGVGMLGCDFELVNDAGAAGGVAYKISRIFTGGPWDADARGPLSQPGVDVKVGDFLLAVNGLPVDATRDPWASLIGTADRITALTVNASPAMDGKEREILVKPISSESGLRYRAWIEANRKYVEEKSGGKVGYIYVPNTGVDGQNDLFRQFYGQRGLLALIIDERWNGGGQIPNRFIELLNRPRTNYWARRDGQDWPWPGDSHQGPKCMLINGLAGSGGDMFPWLFKHHKIGPLIGTRTWGGLVGISGNPDFIDGGSITVPTFGFYETDGTWGVEGHGTDPDIEVIDDPALMVNGGDPQLDRAIAEMLKAIQERPYVKPARPKSPDRKGMGLPASDR
jgi:tricorn protease